MATRKSANAGISDAAVLKATGKDWAAWCKALNSAGCKAMAHPDIANVVSGTFRVGDWWSQMVTVGYERLVQGRGTHQRAKGYSVSGSKTVNAPLGALYKAWTDARMRAKWLPKAQVAIRSAHANKSARITWNSAPKGTSLSINYYAKGPGKSMVQLEHEKLKTAAEARKMKAFWGKRLAALKTTLES